MSNEKPLSLCDGKYTFYMKDHVLYCRRYGEEWRDFIGDNAVSCLFEEAVDTRAERDALQEKVDRVEGLAERWEQIAMDNPEEEEYRSFAGNLRKALEGGE